MNDSSELNDLDLTEYFGTTELIKEGRLLKTGRLSLILEDGNLRDIQFDGVEMIRAISFLVRDKNWGTVAPQLTNLNIKKDNCDLNISFESVFREDNSQLKVVFGICIKRDFLRFHAAFSASGDFQTNRAGFNILHPVQLSGSPLEITDVNGNTFHSSFPRVIDPWQPFKNIRCLTSRYKERIASCLLLGETFEMEDQRNWSDASFKTYSRPLEKPWPYTILNGESNDQSIELNFSGPVKSRNAPRKKLLIEIGNPVGIDFPEMALVFRPEESEKVFDSIDQLIQISPNRITCHFDPEAGHGLPELRLFKLMQDHFPAKYDLEYAVWCKEDGYVEFERLANQLHKSGLCLNSILVCPGVDRQSTPPGSIWPDCPSLNYLYEAARLFFPDIELGGGMMSYFTELNRKRPPLEKLDFVVHGTNPIVHAADDVSVMQTLSSVPFIISSCRTFIGDKAYRLGLSSIPMRQNPYGSSTFENSSSRRLCMAHRDPRQFGRFSAAFSAGYGAMIAPHGVKVWTPAGFSAPWGVIGGNNKLTYNGEVLKKLRLFAGQPINFCTSSNPEQILGLSTREKIIVINLTKKILTVNTKPLGNIFLKPYEVQFFGFE